MLKKKKMPKYYYRCNWCAEEWEEWRSMSDNREVCVCARRLTDFEKIPQPFTTVAATPTSSKRKVGDTTKEDIEDNRKILKQMKKEARSSEFTLDD